MTKTRFLLTLAAVLMIPSFAQPIGGHSQGQSGEFIQETKDVLPGMAFIPSGGFWMGRNQLWLVDELGWNERDRLDDRPVHLVDIDAFYLDLYETTNEEYQRFVQATGHRKPLHWAAGKIPGGKERHPVYDISWDDADAYCKWIGKRLPTEAEWERAARGGLEKKLYPWGDQLSMSQKSSASTPAPQAQNVKAAHTGFPNGPTAVGSYPPSGFGLFDMTGNVWEWVSDWYERDYYSVSAGRNPQGPARGMYRIFRGGGWSDNDERNLMVHYRNYTDPSARVPTIGVRCAKSISANAH